MLLCGFRLGGSGNLTEIVILVHLDDGLLESGDLSRVTVGLLLTRENIDDVHLVDFDVEDRLDSP